MVAKAAEVRRLQDLNDAIAAAIIAHNDEIESQLATQAEREAEQRKKLGRLACGNHRTKQPRRSLRMFQSHSLDGFRLLGVSAVPTAR